ncbi:MAG TPA: HAMP domain-containing sensor histidine kinase [Mycobacterium sp.]|nr:HAMP domain-containing sensor histidine kinase [Mycobacterium sp.]
MEATSPIVTEGARPSTSRMSIEGWPLRWKVAAIMVLPVLLAATFGALRIQNELSAASKLSIASSSARIVVPAVEFVDRVDTLAYAAAANTPIADPLAQFDASAATLSSLITSAEFDSTVANELQNATSTGTTLRDEIAAGPVPQARAAELADDVSSEIATAVATSMATVEDSAVRPLADQLVNVLAAQRALTTQRILVSAPDFAQSAPLRATVAEAAGAEAAAIDRLSQLTSADQTSALRQESDARRDAYARSSDDLAVTPQFVGAMRASADEYHAMAQQLSTDLDQMVHSRANTLRSAALRDTAIFLGAVLAALVFALGVGRSLIRSIGRLRRGAQDVARVQLPEEIDRLSKGGGLPEITALPVHTKEEVGQLARAIDDIHSQAVRLASEHGVRLQIGEMFETLSRRSRSLVEEQLALIETLEHDEDDPARLDHLFRLDHLVTRMRRNGDNLLVLADTVERHRRAEPVHLPEVMRAAMSEVEDYQRVEVGATVDCSIVGTAAGDVGHLIAELLDNALRYSPPDSPVLVTASRAVDAGVLVEIADRGLGMSSEDLHAENERLAVGGEVTSETAKRMGLFVVGRLARRHDATVRLRATAPLTDQPGVTASVHLPGTLIAAPTEISEPRGDADDEPSFRFIENETSGQVVSLPRRDDVSPPGDTDRDADAPAAETDSSVLPGRLPKRSPGKSGVTIFAVPADGHAEPAPVEQPLEEPAAETVSNPFAYFSGRSKPDDSLPQRGAVTEDPIRSTPEAAGQPIQSDGAPIYERMMSEWLTDPSTRGMHAGAWATAADDDWATAAEAVEREPNRHTASGLPIRERGARLVPGHAKSDSDIDADDGPDPTAVRSVLSRALAGVRSGRGEDPHNTEEAKGTND